ncbi:uncharacterized protein LOC112505889 [Cynara cardunculus var. scolymus]|uniref:uncharacterized protein LOC112505889 n=1 Tax=Cynara cardunculus var. scolymus TaxID=59895 RepID=UPI000D62A502|nr:uncharacterized protein LOC112505889 [Cynara cardunculus var. scolymus]
MTFNKFLGFLDILKTSTKIMSKNGKLVAMVTSIYLIISNLFFFLNISTIKPIISDFVTKATELPYLDPQGPFYYQVLDTIQKDVKTLLRVELAFILAFFITSMFVQVAIILLTGISYKDEKIFPKDLITRVLQALTRLFITCFHITLMKVGFLIFGFMALIFLTVMIPMHKIVLAVTIWVLVILVSILFLYFSIVWVLSLVVSVLEECSGLEALGKAERLVKGKKLEGFLVFLLPTLLSFVFFQLSTKMNVVEQSELTRAILEFFLTSCMCLLGIFVFQAYTVLYFECKRNHGEEIELQGSVEYGRISLDEDLP